MRYEIYINRQSIGEISDTVKAYKAFKLAAALGDELGVTADLIDASTAEVLESNNWAD